MKVVINKCYGGFGLSEKALKMYCELKGITEKIYDGSICRSDPVLIEVVERLDNLASGGYAQLKIVEIPDNVEWEIEEYDGIEWVAEVHRTWS